MSAPRERVCCWLFDVTVCRGRYDRTQVRPRTSRSNRLLLWKSGLPRSSRTNQETTHRTTHSTVSVSSRDRTQVRPRTSRSNRLLLWRSGLPHSSRTNQETARRTQEPDDLCASRLQVTMYRTVQTVQESPMRNRITLLRANEFSSNLRRGPDTQGSKHTPKELEFPRTI